ncbi:MAG: hypothetical protein SXV54_28235 [Chloroflexota bacterium]|nr:hypothetical protein [Chloroflexota bacterium]
MSRYLRYGVILLIVAGLLLTPPVPRSRATVNLQNGVEVETEAVDDPSDPAPYQPLGALPAAPLAPDALPAPQQIEPASGTETTGNPSDSTPGRVLCQPLGIPCFQWGSVTGATKYELQVSEVPQDSAIVLDRNNLQQPIHCPTSYEFLLHGIQDEEEYYWRVRAYGGDPAGWGDWSGWWSFTRHWASAPALLQPSATSVLTRPPVLSWTPVDGAEYYKLEISSDSDFPDMTVWPNFTHKLTTRNTAYALGTGNDSKLPNDEDIYWRVRAVSAGSGSEEYRLGPWSDGGSGSGSGRVFGICWSCNLEPELGPGNERRPLPLTPVNLEDHVNSAYFSWTPVEGAAAYDLEINDTPSFQQDSGHVIQVFQNVANPGLLVPINRNWSYPLISGPIYWRVRAKNYYGVYGEWNNETPNVSASFYPEDAFG